MVNSIRPLRNANNQNQKWGIELYANKKKTTKLFAVNINALNIAFRIKLLFNCKSKMKK